MSNLNKEKLNLTICCFQDTYFKYNDVTQRGKKRHRNRYTLQTVKKADVVILISDKKMLKQVELLK